MFTTILPIIIVFALLFEIVTWRTYVRKCGRSGKSRKWLKIIYLVLTIGVITYPLFGILFGSDINMRGVMWGILLMLFNVLSKGIVTFFVLIGQCIRKINGRTVKWIKTAIIVAVAALFLVIAYGVAFGRTILRVENVEIVSDKIPHSFDGYKIVQFSDTHIGNLHADRDLVGRMVDLVNSLQPDLVVQSGDLVNSLDSELTEVIVEKLRKISALDGVVSVLGNHDLGFYIRDTTIIKPKNVVDNIKKTQNELLGWKLLENEHIRIYRDSSYIDVAGVTYPKNLNHNNFNSQLGGSDIKAAFNGLSDSIFRVFVTHNPKLFDSLPAKGRADLVLSGHVHNMQMAINLFGEEFSPASLLYKPYSGLSEKDGMKLYINDGIGYVLYPFRIGSRPEVTVFTLKSSK